MQVKDILRLKSARAAGGERAASVPPESTILEAAKILGRRRIGLLMVIGRTPPFDGVLSERDVIKALSFYGEPALSMKVEQVMTKVVKTCAPTDHSHDVMAAMTSGGFRHMPVVEGRVLTGIISSTDILRYLSEKASPIEQAMLWAKIAWA